MPGVPGAVVKASRQTIDRTPYLSAMVAVVAVSGAGTAVVTSPTIEFGGKFITEPAGGVLQSFASDASGNAVVLHVSVEYLTTTTEAGTYLYSGALLKVASLQDVGSYNAKIHVVFLGRGYK